MMSISFKRAVKSPYLLLSTGFGVGLIPFAPGTFGSGLGLCLYIFFAHFSFPNVNVFFVFLCWIELYQEEDVILSMMISLLVMSRVEQ